MMKHTSLLTLFLVGFNAIGAPSEGEWGVSNKLYSTESLSYELNMVRNFGRYELEVGVKTPLDFKDKVEVGGGVNLLLSLGEEASLVFGGGYGWSSPYVKYGLRYDVFDNSSLDVGYTFYFDQDVVDRDQVYLGFHYFFGDQKDQETAFASLEQENVEESVPKRIEEPKSEVTEIIDDSITIYFPFNRSDIASISSESIDDIKRVKNSKGIIKVIGHADSIDDYGVNAKVSMSRALSVKQLLVEQGVPANRIIASGQGEREPISSNMLSQGRAKNRRVEIEFMFVKPN